MPAMNRRPALALGIALGVAVVIGLVAARSQLRQTPVWTTTGGVSVLWHREVGPVYGALFANDTVFAKMNGLSALDPATGSERWQANVPNPQWLDHDGNTIYSTGIFAIDAETGHIRWRADPGEGRIVAAGDRSSRRLIAACGDGDVCAFNKTGGRELWSVHVGRRVDALTVASSMVFVGNIDGDVIGLDAVTGAEKWRARATTSIVRPPDPQMLNDIKITGLATAQGTVYAVIAGGSAVALDAETGNERWHWTMQKGPPPMARTWFPGRPPVVVDGLLYVSTEYHDLFAIDARTGHEVWRLEFAWQDRELPASTPAAEDRPVLDFVDATTAQRNWRVETGYLRMSPIFVNDTFLVSACLNGNCSFFALDSATGEREWEVKTDGFVHDPAVTTEAIYGGTSWTRVEFPSARRSGGSIFALAVPPERPQ